MAQQVRTKNSCEVIKTKTEQLRGGTENQRKKTLTKEKKKGSAKSPGFRIIWKGEEDLQKEVVATCTKDGTPSKSSGPQLRKKDCVNGWTKMDREEKRTAKKTDAKAARLITEGTSK